MSDEERVARELQARLGDEARVVGEGVHWDVDIARGSRSCRVHFFWYGDMAGLMFGMNPANARASGRPAPRARSGAEYLVRFHDGETRVVSGRTQPIEAAIGAIRDWLDGASVTKLYDAWPFVDERRRRFNELLAIVSPSCRDVARCVIDVNISAELWIYGRGRSCRLNPGDAGVSAEFWLGPAQVGFGDVTTNAANIVSQWVHGATLADLSRLGISIEQHAELIESGDVARWHWLHTRARIEDPGDVLADSRPLLERLAERELPTTFFSYSSLNRFCFSASSHFPWVDHGLPIINPPYKDRGYFVDVDNTRAECTVDQAIEVIERALAQSPVAPFFGSYADVTIRALDAELAKAGSVLRGELRQHCQWFSAAVVRGDRHCIVNWDLQSCVFHQADRALRATFTTATDTIAAIRHWLEERWTIDELRLLPSALEAAIEEPFSGAD